MRSDGVLLTIAGMLSAVAGIAHLLCIAGGPAWFRFMGAGEGVASAVERGAAWPVLVTLAIAGMLFLWSAYAFSGAGLLPRLPLLRTGLVAISLTYLARAAMVLMPGVFNRPDLSSAFMWWSSAIVLFLGLAYAIGTWRAWPFLSSKESF